MKKPSDYVEIAVATLTNDERLKSTYRVDTRLIGTDGHRMHWLSGLAPVAAGYFTSGIAEEPPGYDAVIPKNPKMLSTFIVTKAQHRALTSMYKAGQTSMYPTNLYMDRFGVVAESSQNIGAMTVDMRVQICSITGDYKSLPTIRINLKYFLDAIIPDREVVVSAKLDRNGPNKLTMLMLTTQLPDTTNANAVIMPMMQE